MTRYLFIISGLFLLTACGRDAPSATSTRAGAGAAANAFERGPHHGRMLRDGGFALELTIHETNTPPQFRLYAYQDGKPVEPDRVKAAVELKRLAGEVDRFRFRPEGDYLVGSDTVVEPHSFDIKVTATHTGKSHTWAYASYEGRTTIPAEVARAAGVEVEEAGPAVIRETLALLGTIVIPDSRRASLRARFPGAIRSVQVKQGEHVRRGQPLVVIESNQSLRSYTLTAPFDGVVLARHANVGEFSGDEVLIELADLSQLWVDLRAFGSDAARLQPGQKVRLHSATGRVRGAAKIEGLLPLLADGQSVIARAALSNPDGRWRPGMVVSAQVTVAEREVPLAVKTSALQPFRDFTVVFAQVSDVYEVRMLQLGRRGGGHVEVLGGLKPGTRYVTEQSYLIKADIEKSGAKHAH